MTIRDLLKNRSTLDQYEILQAADLMFMGQRLGRHFGGQLTDGQVKALVPKDKKNQRVGGPAPTKE